MLNTEVFLNFLLSVKQSSRAETISLVIKDNHAQQSDAILLHEGPRPLSEFSTVERVLNIVGDQSDNIFSSLNLICILNSNDEKGLIIAINCDLYHQYLENNSLSEETERRKKNQDGVNNDGMILVGLNFGFSEMPEFIKTLIRRPTNQTLEFSETSTDWFLHTLCQGAAMVWQVFQFANLFKEPTSSLPGRMAFQIYLKKMIMEGRQSKTDIGLVFINPDEFVTINQRLGWSQGDLTLTEIAGRLQSFLRKNDLIFRYGGAIFALILPATTIKEVNAVTEKIRSGLAGNYTNISTKLTFSIGAAIHQSMTGDEIRDCVDNLIKQTDQALNVARLSGGGKSVIWDKNDKDFSVLNIDNTGNIVISDSENDYRNMLLLWDTIVVISTAYDAKKIAVEFIDRVKLTLKPFRIGLFEEKNDGSIHPLVTRYDQEADDREWQLSKIQKKLLENVQQEKRIERIRFTDKNLINKQKIEFVAYGFPLLVRGLSIGYLYIDGPEISFVMGSSDLIFLNALTCQVAVALDRAALEFRAKEEKEKESRLLKREVRELRKVIHSAKLIYRSSQMQSLLETLSSVAPTDVTILINGESGTGKEMLARAIHEQSPRKNKPLITVDCGAIAISLMEAELFGHVKGAYTGAHSASPGRILQAEGGTLFLDEIGELPLDVQAKLLRFVQEKEITPVGGGKTRNVDVRIVAATNRDLAEEVAAGRFRGDLYYRLQVITLLAPPLRARPDDIIPLARHFLEKYAVQYEKGMLHLNDEVEKALLVYQWPGNIRELQNVIMRAAIISKTDSIDLEVLNLKPSVLSEPVGNVQPDVIDVSKSLPGLNIPTETDRLNLDETKPDTDILERLRQALLEKIKVILDVDKVIATPIGKWLNEDLVLVADHFDRGVARRASLRLGIPETTFRRQIVKLKQAEQAGVLSRTADWINIKPFLVELVTSGEKNSSINMLEQVRTILLQEIFIQTPNNKVLGSSLMGVTLPTYQRWLDKLD